MTHNWNHYTMTTSVKIENIQYYQLSNLDGSPIDDVKDRFSIDAVESHFAMKYKLVDNKDLFYFPENIGAKKMAEISSNPEFSDAMRKLNKFHEIRDKLNEISKKWIIGYHAIHKDENHLAICLRWFNGQFVTHIYNVETEGYCNGVYLGTDISLLEAKKQMTVRARETFSKNNGYTLIPLMNLYLDLDIEM